MEVINGAALSVNKQKALNLEEWSKLISEWKSSHHESQKGFCARLNLNIN